MLYHLYINNLLFTSSFFKSTSYSVVALFTLVAPNNFIYNLIHLFPNIFHPVLIFLV